MGYNLHHGLLNPFNVRLRRNCFVPLLCILLKCARRLGIIARSAAEVKSLYHR